MAFIDNKKFKNRKLSEPTPKGCCYNNSFNELTLNPLSNLNLIDNAKIFIVGTLTPTSGKKYGYFYMSDNPNQYQYRILDDAFNDKKSLQEEKKKLINNPKSVDIIKNIEEILYAKKIAFIDVVKEAYVKNGSSKDDDIKEYVLDIDSFEEILDKTSKKNEPVLFIANSKNAMVALEYILNTLKAREKIELVPQQPRCQKGGYKAIMAKMKTLI